MLRASFLARLLWFLAVFALPSLAQPAADLAALNGEVERLYQAQKYAEALPLALKYLDEIERAHGPADLQTASAANWVGLILAALKRPTEAEIYLRRVVDIRQQLLGGIIQMSRWR